MSIIIFVVNFAALFIGYSVFFSKTVRCISHYFLFRPFTQTLDDTIQINLVKLILHALGGMRIAMFTTYEFNYKMIWQILLVHNVPSLLLDVWVLFSTGGLKKKTY